MFANSVVSAETLAFFQTRTSAQLQEGGVIDIPMVPVIEAFTQIPHIATVLCCAGHVRVENGKRRTRTPHHVMFVVDKDGYETLERMYQLWQETEYADVVMLSVSRLLHMRESGLKGYYPIWKLQFCLRPEPEVVERVCATWVKIAKVLKG
jgi:tRNA(Phe) wybutosine-synthesizing methylase Tyw3